MNPDQVAQMGSGQGFVAALDQSGGSTPKALGAYGLTDDAWSNDDEMYDLVHAMRSRIMQSPAFSSDRVIAAILFEMTMDRDVDGQPTPDYLWHQRGVVPFVKCDKGLADEVDGGQLLKPMPELGELLQRARELNVFGTKMRSVINQANPAAVAAVASQQFDIGLQILDAGLMPIIEPEVNIHCPDKAEAEDLLHGELMAGLDRLGDGQQVMFKLTLPEIANRYSDFVSDPRVLRVVALSGGYSRTEANGRLAQNNGVIASFSRAFAEGLSAQQTDAEFDSTLAATADEIYAASIT